MGRCIPAVAVAGAIILACAIPAAAVDGTLPGGIGIAVDVDLPVAGTVVPKGTVTVTGTASVGTVAATPTTSVVYVLDSSGSLAQQGWDAEKDAIAEFHQQVAQKPYFGVGSVGLASFSTLGRSFDVSPAPGKQLLTAPGGNDFLTALHALPWDDGSTNFTAGLRAGTEIATAATEPRTIMVFLSDGRSNIPGDFEGALAAVPERADIYTVAFGPDATCNAGSDSLQRMADATGGRCVQAAGVGDVLTVLRTLFVSELHHLTLTVDGGPDLPITDVTPALPRPGPQQVTYSVETPPLGVGTHPLCVTAHGSDFGGAGTVTDCTHVIILDPSPSQPPSSPPATSSPPSSTSAPASPATLPPGIPGNRQVSVIPRGGVATGDGTFGW